MRGSRHRWLLFSLAALLAGATLSACGTNTPKASGAAPSEIVDVAVQVAHTSLGDVCYRVIGSGPDLVLIMGYAGTMETWDPHFIDMLARHFRVVIFDNAGIGKTADLHSPLSIDEMADQTSALITTLHLGSPDVLGWSMGGMIAQALAVLHPAQVHRLVLCATFPGTGVAVPPTQTAIAALTSGNPAASAAVLFPANQALAAAAFGGSLAAYPGASSVSVSVIAAQGGASLSWFEGGDSAGHKTSAIVAPTLIADGASDRIDAAANSRVLSTLIPHSQLVFYSDAGHAFLFQEGAAFTFLVRTFLLGPPAPVSVAKMRKSYLVDYKKVTSAGKIWVSKLKLLTSTSPPRDIALLDVSLADVVGAFDDEMLNFGATGALGAAVKLSVNAEERSVRDLLALGSLSGSLAKSYTATATHDDAVALTLENALRRQFNLPAVTTTTTNSTTTTTTENL
jgi:pimeloyl-ACP methyl ester carboxylesterase